MFNVLKRIVVLAIIYVGTVAALIGLGGRDKKDLTTKMEDASLPIMHLSYESIPINELYGYTTQMTAMSMRDSITPLSSDYVIPITVDTYGQAVDQLTYEVRSLSGDRLIQDGLLDNFSVEDNEATIDLKLQKLMNKDEEYELRLGLNCDGQTIYYYTRIIDTDECNVMDSIDLVTKFHDDSMSGANQTFLASYMEPNETEENTTLQRTTIHSNLTQLTWADFDGTQVSPTIPTIKEVNSTYNVLTISYIMSSVGDDGELEYYNVEEYYRVRKGLERMYLLNYERTMEEIFRGENQKFSDHAIQLGICSPDIKYYANKSGRNVCFVQEGELWTFNNDSGRLTQAFSFRSFEGIDDRENYDQHDIQVQNIDEGGNIDFIVYGYMNRGVHEGQVGISVCRYDASTNAVEEELFLPSTESYQIMKEKMCRLLYNGDNGCFYFATSGKIYKVDLESRQTSVLVEGLGEDDFCVSQDGQYVAWIDGEANGMATTMHLMDLETEQITDISAEEGSYIKPLTFMGTDLVYGFALKSDVEMLETSNVFPMYKVCIADCVKDVGNVVKTYEKSGYYVTGAMVKDYTIYLTRVWKNDNIFCETTDDTIVNQEVESQGKVTLESYYDEVKELQYQLKMPEGNKVRSVRLLTPTWIVSETDPTLELDIEDIGAHYYAFAKGEVLLGTSNLRQAIDVANENMGVVIDEKQQYVWKRAKKTSQSPLGVPQEVEGENALQRAIAIMEGSAGMTVKTDLDQTNLTELANALNAEESNVKWLDLSGCHLDELFYYVSQGTPVLICQSDSMACLLIGYDEKNVTVQDPISGEKTEMAMEDASASFENAGNLYFTFVK